MMIVARVRKRTRTVRMRKRKHLEREEEEEALQGGGRRGSTERGRRRKRVIPLSGVFSPFRSMWQHCIAVNFGCGNLL